MRIAMVDPSLFTLHYDAALVGGLREAGHEVTLHGRRPGPDDPDSSGIGVAGDFYCVADSRLLRRAPKKLRLAVKGIDHVGSMLALLARLRRTAPDVIHFQWLALPVADRLLLRPLRAIAPIVLTVHDTNPFNGDPAAAIQGVGIRRCLARFDRLIAHTSQGRQRLAAQGLDTGRIAVLPHGIALPRRQGPDDPMTGEITFVLFGKMKPYKGIDLLIEAFARLPEALRAQARLHIVGKPYMDLAPLFARLEDEALRQRVTIDARFVPEEEVPALFPPGSVAVFPYREIEASGVLFQVIGLGRPVIATRLGAFAELIADGRHGHLTAVDDAAAFAAAMAHVIADRGFAADCAMAVRKLYDTVPPWRDIALSTVDVYRHARASRHLAAPPRLQHA